MAKIQLCSTSYKWSVQFVHRKIALTGLRFVLVVARGQALPGGWACVMLSGWVASPWAGPSSNVRKNILGVPLSDQNSIIPGVTSGSWVASDATQLGDRLCSRIHFRDLSWSSVLTLTPGKTISFHEREL